MITSTTNKTIVETAKLQQKKYRDKSGLFIIEGLKLVDEMFKSGIFPVKIFALQEILNKIDFDKNNVVPVNEKVLAKLSSQKNPEGIIAVIKETDLLDEKTDLKKIVLLDNIRDPGNLGTIIRTADAAGFEQVYCSENCTDLFNDKVIRSTMGSIFHIPVIRNVNLEKKINDLKSYGFTIIATSLNGDILYLNDVKIPERLALILGNESHGIRSNLQNLSDLKYKLPIYGQAESLNVSVAAGIFMYAFIDQKVT